MLEKITLSYLTIASFINKQMLLVAFLLFYMSYFLQANAQSVHPALLLIRFFINVKQTISENLNQQQIDFMLVLDDYELDIFTLDELKNKFNNKFQDINELVENLVHKKILSRIERGKYCRANFNDEKVIGCFICDSGAIAYWSALNTHGLTEQFSNNLFIQTSRPKRSKTIFGTSYKFVNIVPSKITGILLLGQGNKKYRITDIEKTIVDCFDLHEYSGGYAELIREFNQAKLSSDKMITYCTAIDNIAATKRMGFLAELLEKKGLKTFVKYAKQQKNQSYNVFDPSGKDKGEFVNEWRLRLNISRNEILDICNKQY
jgi:predicted transcriptional regulator of viral defense system